MASERLFVYGSLKRDGRHHAELRGARFLGEAQTAPGYRLVSMGDYLALVEQAGASPVPGELFEVDEALLLGLDEFEGDAYERTYVRCVRIAAVQQSGPNALALAYLRRTR